MQTSECEQWRQRNKALSKLIEQKLLHGFFQEISQTWVPTAIPILNTIPTTTHALTKCYLNDTHTHKIPITFLCFVITQQEFVVMYWHKWHGSNVLIVLLHFFASFLFCEFGHKECSRSCPSWHSARWYTQRSVQAKKKYFSIVLKSRRAPSIACSCECVACLCLFFSPHGIRLLREIWWNEHFGKVSATTKNIMIFVTRHAIVIVSSFARILVIPNIPILQTPKTTLLQAP